MVMMKRHHRARRSRRRGFALVDVIVSGILLAIGLTTILTLAARGLRLQQQGEQEILAAALLDELLSSVLTEGPVDFPKLHDTFGRFEAPFDEFEFEIEIEDPAVGDPYAVTATVTHDNGTSYSVATLIAMKLGEETDPIREPDQPVDREGRYEEDLG